MKTFAVPLAAALLAAPFAGAETQSPPNSSSSSATISATATSSPSAPPCTAPRSSAGWRENNLVVWTSDNGSPPARDSGDLSRGSNLPLPGRGYTTSEGAFRVPTLMRWPGKVPAATLCDELASTMDLYPTFVKRAGGEVDSVKRGGHDITALVVGEEGAKSPWEVFAYYRDP